MGICGLRDMRGMIFCVRSQEKVPDLVRVTLPLRTWRS
jgi:hypothetical protein